MNPIHPDLAPLAGIAKTFSKTFRAPGILLEPLVSLHVYGVAADCLTTGINRIYGEA